MTLPGIRAGAHCAPAAGMAVAVTVMSSQAPSDGGGSGFPVQARQACVQALF